MYSSYNYIIVVLLEILNEIYLKKIIIILITNYNCKEKKRKIICIFINIFNLSKILH